MRNYIARLDPVTASADPFDPLANGFVNALVVQPDGKILPAVVSTASAGKHATESHASMLILARLIHSTQTRAAKLIPSPFRPTERF